MNNLQTLHVINIIWIFILLLTFGCSSQKENKEEQYSYEIYSLLLKDFNYTDYTYELPSPPLIYDDDYTKQDYKDKIDSLKVTYKDKKLKISLLIVLLGGLGQNYHKDKGDKNQIFLNRKLNKMKSVPLDTTKLLFDKNKLIIEFIDMVKLKDNQKMYFDNYQFLLAFSRVIFLTTIPLRQ